MIKPGHKQWASLTAAQYITGRQYGGHVYTCWCNLCTMDFDPDCLCGKCSAKRGAYVEQQRGATMSQVSICDRCESMALGKAMGTALVRYDPTMPVNEWDICPECVKELMDWYHSPGLRTGKAYKEPYREPVPEDVQATEMAVLNKVVREVVLELESSKVKDTVIDG